MSNAVSFHPINETISNEDLSTEVDGPREGINALFNMNIRQSKAHLSDPTGHDVSFNITFAMAVPGIFTNIRGNESFSTRNSSADPIRTGNQFFHIEFDLFEKEISKEPFKTDIVFCGTFAKIYPDKSDSKVVPTWSDGEDTWICWVQRFVFRVSLRHIQSLANHKMVVKVWDTKDKCLPKVRFDHPKPPKQSNRSRSLNDVTSWIKETVMIISHDFSNTASFLENADRILPHQIVTSTLLKKDSDTNIQRNRSAKSNTTTKSSASSPDIIIKEKETLIICAEPKEDSDANLGSYLQLEKLLETKSSNKSNFETKKENVPKKTNEIPSSGRFTELSNTMRPESRKSIVLPTEMERFNKMGKICLDIRTADLFLTDQTISRSPASVNTVEDMFFMITIEEDIFSSDQRKDLNPLTINIRKIENVPNKSDDFSELNKFYLPMYCEYQFSDLEPHQTVSRAHAKHVRFDDVSVVLVGILNKINLKSQIQNSFFTIKLFDRIENPCQENEDNVDLKDNMNMGDVNITSSTPTITKVMSHKPRGEAKIDLSDFVTKGLKYLEVLVPIIPISDNNLKPEIDSVKKHPEDTGSSYLDAETLLKISFKLANQISFTTEPSQIRLYNRIVIINNNSKCEFVRKELSMEILRHNCGKLNFNSETYHEMQTFLFSTVKQFSEKESLLNGAYIVDRQCEVLIIESDQECVSNFYELCSSKLDHYQERYSRDLKILYNQSLNSKEKSNFSILTMLPLVLSKDIAFFVSQPLLYVRDMLPRECVDGICKIKELIGTDSMHIALRNKLIPTNQMIESISQYLCSHITSENDIENVEVIQLSEQKSVRNSHRKDIKTAPQFEKKKIQQPIKRSETQLSAQYVYPKPGCEFSYSCQTLNSVSSAKQLIRQKMDPHRRYTYSQDYLFSGSFDPVDKDDVHRTDEQFIRSEPRWINKEHQSTIKDVASINTLPQSRRDSLQTQWIENTLHRSFMEPTLPERDDTSFKFDLYIRPLKILARDSNSIMPSYLEQKQINKAKERVDNEIWRKKVCVSDMKFRSHRSLPETEMIERGRLSSNQIAKLQGLRKDKTSVKQRCDANSIPSTYVIPASNEIKRSYTVGPNEDKNLLINYVPVMGHDKNFNSVYKASKDTFIYKNTLNKIQTKFVSPFSVYC